MSYTARPIDDQKTYDDFLKTPSLKPHLTFMHTWEWGDVIKEGASQFERLGIYDDDNLIGLAQVVKKPLRLRGSFWYSPRGIAMDYHDKTRVTIAYNTLNQYIKNKGASAFLRVDPDLLENSEEEELIDELRPKHAPMFTQAERVWCVDIQADEKSQLDWMKQHGMRSNVPRYLRRAVREGATVRISDKEEDLEKLIELLALLRDRKHMSGGSDDHLRHQFKTLAPKGYEKIIIAEKDGQVVSAALLSFYGREASYLHGASTELFRELNIPHLMHFEAMKYCMTERPEIERYNFWGIVSDKNRTPKHPRNGYSEFKRSFGGYKEQYIRARDFVYQPFNWRLDWFLQKYFAWKYKND